MIVGSDTSIASLRLPAHDAPFRVASHPIQFRWVRGTTFRWFKQLSPMTPRIHASTDTRPIGLPAKLSERSPSEFPVKSSLVAWVLLLCCVGPFGVSSEPVTPEKGERGGIISTILEWFRGGEETSPQLEPETGRNDDAEDISTSHVYRAAADLLAEIEVLRRAARVTDAPPTAEVTVHPTFAHAYTKALEVQVKTAQLQKRLGMLPVEVASIPVNDITPRICTATSCAPSMNCVGLNVNSSSTRRSSLSPSVAARRPL